MKLTDKYSAYSLEKTLSYTTNPYLTILKNGHDKIGVSK